MVYCFSKWRCYLEGAPKVYMHTDHEPLTWIKTQSALNRRLSHWLEFMARFTYQVLYVKGDKNVVADALTRMLDLPENDQPDLPGEWWPHAVNVLTQLHGYRPRPAETHQRASGLVGATAYPRCPTASMDGRTELHSSGRSRTLSQTALRAGVCAFPIACRGYVHVLAGGFTRSRAGHDSSTGETSGTTLKSSLKRSTAKVSLSSNPHKHIRFGQGPEPGLQPMKMKSLSSPTKNVTQAEHIPMESSEKGIDHPLETVEPTSSHQALHKYDMVFGELFERIRTGLQYDSTTATEEQGLKLSLKTENDLLWKDNKLYIPDYNRIREDILYWHHDVPWAAHLGIEKTLELVKRQFWWPNLGPDIRTYISTCTDCQKNKTDRISRTPLLSPLVPPDSCWHTIGVDLIVDLPPTNGEKYDAICVFVCHLSKMARLIPTHKDLNAIGFGKLFFKEVFPHYGMPYRIISDNGTTWKNEFFQSLCSESGIRMNLSTAYHPQTNGLVERTNEVVETALRHYVSSSQDDWDSYLPLVEFALNSAYHKSLESTPFQMNRVSIPKNPFEALLKPDSTDSIHTTCARWMGVSKDPTENGARTVAQAQSQFDWARKCVHLAKMKMKQQHDKKVTSTHLHAAGDRVWFNVKHIKLKHPTHRHKFIPKFIGPFLVLESIGRSAVKLDFPSGMQIHPTVSTSLVKPFHPRTAHQLPPVNIQGFEEFEVTDITQHNILKSKRKNGLNLVEFLVRWKGYYEDTWEDFDNFTHSMDLVNAYLSNACNKAVRHTMYTILSSEQRSRLNQTLQQEANAHLQKKKQSEDT